LISVVIPAFNEKANLKRLVPLLDQLSTKHTVEVLISVGTCKNSFCDSLKAFENLILVAEKRKGRAKQMNDGVTASKGDILVFLHADVIPPKGFFNDIERTIAAGYDAGFFSYRFDKDSFLLRMNASFTKRDGLFTGGGDQCLFIKKSTFETLGGFNEEQILMEDFEFFKRMKKKSIAYKIVPNDLLVSARKYEKNSYLRVNLSNLLLVVLFKMGVSPLKLKSLHNRLLRLDYQKTTV
jgi:rSAM/selenodomain-associated transferase 2